MQLEAKCCDLYVQFKFKREYLYSGKQSEETKHEMTRERNDTAVQFSVDDTAMKTTDGGALERFGRSKSVWNLQTRQSASVMRSSSWSLAETRPGEAEVVRRLKRESRITRKFSRKSKQQIEGLRISFTPCLSGDIDAVDIHGRSLLFYAVRYGQVDPTRLLLQTGCYVNQQDNLGFTPLHEAIGTGNSEIAMILLYEGEADTNVPDINGQTPLHLAIARGNVEAVRLLHKCGADINKCDNDGNSPLCNALTAGWNEIVEFLMDKQCDVTAKSATGETCLFLSSKSAKIQLCHFVKRLLKTDYDFRQDSEWLGGDGCPQSFRNETKLYNKLLERAGLKAKSRKSSILSSGKRKLLKSIRHLSR